MPVTTEGSGGLQGLRMSPAARGQNRGLPLGALMAMACNQAKFWKAVDGVPALRMGGGG